MERAKEYLQETYMGVINAGDDITIQERDDLKKEINSLLHTYMPTSTTLGEAEAIACTIMELITNPKYFIYK